MQIIQYYHDPAKTQKTPVLDRAAQRSHMLRKTLIWDILLLVVLSVSGPVIHYYAPLLCRIPVLQVFVPVSESVWEHLKLLFFPAALVLLLRYLVTGNLQKGIVTTFSAGLWRAMLLMIGGFYTCTGILGKLWLPADIALYYLCVLFLVLYIRRHATGQKKGSLPGMLFMLLMAGCLIWFTYHVPQIGLFLS